MAPQLFLAQKKARMGGGGSSGVHAMDGQSGDGAREGETLGKGGSHPESEALGTGGSHPESETSGKGSSDAHSDKSDGRCSANFPKHFPKHTEGDTLTYG